MNFKSLMLALAASSALWASAQTQGYLDGIEYYKADQYANAQEILQRNLNNPETDRATSLYYLGAVDLKTGFKDAAQKKFNEGIAANPKVGLNYVGLGAIDLANGDLKAAQAQFKAATKAENKAPVLVAIARAYYEADPVAYAKEYESYMKKATDKDKKCPDIYIMNGDKYRDEAIASGDANSPIIGKAAEEYSMAQYFDPENPAAYVKYSKLFAKLNPPYSIGKLQELLSQKPNSALAQRELAERYYDSDQWTKAAEQYGKYIENPNHFLQDEERYAVLLYTGGNYQKSLEVAKAGLAKNPNSAQMKRMVMLDEFELGNYEAAKAAAEDFFTLNNVRFTRTDYNTYANTLAKLGDYDGQIQALEKAVEINPDNVDVLRDLTYALTNAGSRAYRDDKNAEALADYKRAIACGEKVVEAGGDAQDINLLGRNYYNAANVSPEDAPDRAELVAKGLQVLKPISTEGRQQVNALRTIMQLEFLGAGNKSSEAVKDACQKLIDAMNANPENATKNATYYRQAYAYMANYYLENGDKAMARECLENALKYDPDNEGIKEVLKVL